jgi:hypothetical protein
MDEEDTGKNLSLVFPIAVLGNPESLSPVAKLCVSYSDRTP